MAEHFLETRTATIHLKDMWPTAHSAGGAALTLNPHRFEDAAVNPELFSVRIDRSKAPKEIPADARVESDIKDNSEVVVSINRFSDEVLTIAPTQP